jgi:hypothetical protein
VGLRVMEKEVIVSASPDVPSDIQALRDFYGYWVELSGDGGTPRLDDFDYTRFSPQSENIAEMEIRYPGGDIYFRSAGSLITELAVADVTGRRCADVYGGPNLEGFERIVISVVRDGVPAHVTQGFHSRAGYDYLLESVFLPFLSDDGRPIYVGSMTYVHDKTQQWPSYDEGGFIRHHQLVEDIC